MRSNYRAIPKNSNFTGWYTQYLRSSARGWDARAMVNGAYPSDQDKEHALDEILRGLDKEQIDMLVEQTIERSGLTGDRAEEYATVIRSRLSHLTNDRNRAGIVMALRS